MKWYAIKKASGQTDEYAICFATHTVAKVVVAGRTRFEAYRLGAPSVCIGTFHGERGPELAKLACEEDTRQRYAPEKQAKAG